MAQIVNEEPLEIVPKKSREEVLATSSAPSEPTYTDPRAGLNQLEILELLKRKRKSLYDHVSFRKLYQYSDTVCEIRGLSKTAFSKHVEAHKAFWQTLHTRAGTFVDFDTTNPLFTNNGAIQYAKNLNGYGFYSIPITDPREPDESGDQYSVVSSVIHVVDGYHGICMDKETSTKILETLSEYFALGIYPTICIPMSFKDQMETAEKYGAVTRADDIGILIDLQLDAVPAVANATEESEEEPVYYLLGTVLWSPKSYIAEYNPAMYGCFSGTLEMTATSPLPSSWDSINEVCNLIAPGYPIFEYRPNTMVLQTITANHELRDLIDVAITTNQISFGFVDHLVAQMYTMKEALEKIPETTHPVPAQHMPVEVKPDEEDEALPGPAYESEKEVPVEDASTFSDVTRRMRLYGSSDESTPEPIYDAFRSDDYDD